MTVIKRTQSVLPRNTACACKAISTVLATNLHGYWASLPRCSVLVSSNGECLCRISFMTHQPNAPTGPGFAARHYWSGVRVLSRLAAFAEVRSGQPILPMYVCVIPLPSAP